RKADAELDAWEGGKNLLFVSYIKPHHPFDPPARFLERFEKSPPPLLPGWTDQADPELVASGYCFFPNELLREDTVRRVTGGYYAAIEQIDEGIGRLLATLDAKGLYEKTTIVFLADHGEYLGSHHLLLKNNLMFEPLVRIPLIVKWGEDRRISNHDHRLVSLLDLAPTLLKKAGMTPPGSMRGMDLRDPNNTRDFVFASQRGGLEKMARSRRYKLIHFPKSCLSKFFDLEQDPLELENRIDDPVCKAEVASHLRALRNWCPLEEFPTSYLDLQAPVVSHVSDNAASRKLYFQKKMKDLQETMSNQETP
ncbi:MAG: sulfatase-like hydrolase/transferase, partial [Spirochaetia bacterium]|nr:sulfatase-like hydrolase/transferase [Spirochaetia bacterium]